MAERVESEKISKSLINNKRKIFLCFCPQITRLIAYNSSNTTTYIFF
ncbi:hypothetical protein J2792_002908 [Novosphingobium capsulatum]|uniref:Uncharacterized protein n=1 Tax=Novosphingobium capsulatum TaxID=13688 RepID=A0ABU1MNU8_9SPHN|nr:hypothetical protein [Novosphingobium capsulatum]